MVQICSECNVKHSNSAETMTDKHSDSGKSLIFGNGGRFSPSDTKSLANSDSSYVRFKVKKWVFIAVVRIHFKSMFEFKFHFSRTNPRQHTQFRAEIVISLIQEKIPDQIHH